MTRSEVVHLTRLSSGSGRVARSPGEGRNDRPTIRTNQLPEIDKHEGGSEKMFVIIPSTEITDAAKMMEE
jgi:hypothetical protein